MSFARTAYTQKVLFWIGLSVVFLNHSSCTSNLLVKYNSVPFVILKETAGSEEVLLYREQKGTWLPFRRLLTNQTISLPVGTYLAVTACSSYRFDHLLPHTQLVTSTVSFVPDSTVPPEGEVPSLLPVACQEAVVNQGHTFYNQWDFSVLPGTTTFSVGGRAISFMASATEAQVLTQTVTRVDFTLPPNLNFSSLFEFFLTDGERPQHQQKGTQVVQAVPVPSRVWLLPALYQAELSGSMQILDLRSLPTTQAPKSIALSALRVATPAHFPFELRSIRGGEPLYVQLNDQIPLRYNTTYPLFAGSQTLALQGSALRQVVALTPNEITVVKTTGVFIDDPACTTDLKKRSQDTLATTDECVLSGVQIGIHEPQKPFSLIVEQAGLPFVIFSGNYQYSVEGLGGLNKNIQNLPCTSTNFCTDRLMKVRLVWQDIDTTDSIKTDFVRFEASGGNVSGKTVDLLLFRPNNVFLPQGSYTLSYLIKSASGRKVLQQINTPVIGSSITNDFTLTIPLYQQIDGPDKTPQRSVPVFSEDQDKYLQPIY